MDPDKDQQKRRKILYIITKSNFGGAQRYTHDMATSLPKSDFDVTVIMGGAGKLKEMLDEAGVKTMSIERLGRDIRPIDEFFVLSALFSIIRNERPNIIHLNSSKIGGLGALAGRIYNLLNYVLNLLRPAVYPLQPTRIIFTAHGWAFNEERSFFSRTIIRILAWLTVMLSHFTIAVSKKIQQEAPSFLVPKNKIILIYNGIRKTDLLRKKEARAYLSQKIGEDIGENIVVGTMSELHKNKGLSYAIEAVGKLKKTYPKIRYVILGEGEERKRLEKTAKRYRLGKTVFMPGFVDNAPKYLPAFDIFLLPSITEALGLSILEAGAAELPVIAASVGGIPEIIEDMKTGILVRPRQPNELGGAVRFLLENKDRASEFGKNLNKKVSEQFSLEKMTEETLKLYR